jgi:hypothetical protein
MFALSTDNLSKGMTHEASILIHHFSFLDLIASWTVEITLDMYLICAGATIGWSKLALG